MHQGIMVEQGLYRMLIDYPTEYVTALILRSYFGEDWDHNLHYDALVTTQTGKLLLALDMRERPLERII